MTEQHVWVRIARPDLPAGRVTTVVAGDRAVCVVHGEDGTWSALDNRCPHQGGPLGDGRHWWPWVTMTDEVRAIEFCLTQPSLRGPVNVASPQPQRNVEVARALGRALHRPAVVAVPTVVLRLSLGEFASDITASQRMLPTALLAAGFSFTHTDIDQACRWLVDG